MPPLVFYHAPFSTSSSTEAVLAALNVPHEVVTLSISDGDTRKPAHLARNPNGRVPTIEHQGVYVWESAAITLYLGETFGVANGLYPAPGPKRGEAMKWVVWANTSLAEAGGRLAANLPRGSSGGVQEGSADDHGPIDEAFAAAQATKAKHDIGKLLSVLNGALEGKEFLLGDYTVVDVHVNSFVGWLSIMGINLEEYPNVAKWVLRIDQIDG